MSVPLLDLKAQFTSIESEIRKAIDGVLDSQRFIMGPEVTALEEEIAKYVSCSHGVGVSSGTDALLLALMALEVGPGDEVITTPFTFFATGGTIHRLGAKPVFVDIESQSFNLDPNKLSEKITSKTKAIMAVHLFGQSADMDGIAKALNGKDIPIIEDAAQSIGTEYQGKRVGSIGKIGCFSFFPSKNLGAFGDGGIVTCNDQELAEKMKILRVHGAKPKYFHKWVGGNFRLDALQAAIVRVKFRHLDQWSKKRDENAARYDELLKDAKLEEFVIPPWRRKGDRHIFNQYTIRTKDRDSLQKHLKEKGIGNEIYYPLPLHLQECFAYLGEKEGSYPEAEKAAKEVLSVPIYPELSQDQQDRVVSEISSFYRT